MGSSSAETPPNKAPKTSSAQEQPPVAAAPGAALYPEWGGFQTYAAMPPHGFFPSPMASGTQAPHPYMWGAQHMMPGYATHPPYVMYPPGGIYAHPTLHHASPHFPPYPMHSPNGNVEAPGGEDVDGKSSDCKETNPLKHSKGGLGSLQMLTGKSSNEIAKNSGASNGAGSQSGESGSEDSSEGSDANSQKDSQTKAGKTEGSLEAEITPNGKGANHGSQNGGTRITTLAVLNQGLPIMPIQVTGAPAGVSGPTTNLNIGMDYWVAPASSPMVPLHGKLPTTQTVAGLAPSGIGGNRENLSSDHWLQQDERELKRQRRKQSNRESARRSRLRKQAECEELGRRVDAMNEENASLRAELDCLKQGYQQLLSENTSLKERIDEVPKNNEARLDLSDLHNGVRQNLNSDVQEAPTDNIPTS